MWHQPEFELIVLLFAILVVVVVGNSSIVVVDVVVVAVAMDRTNGYFQIKLFFRFERVTSDGTALNILSIVIILISSTINAFIRDLIRKIQKRSLPCPSSKETFHHVVVE
jgi:hypothetical protein